MPSDFFHRNQGGRILQELRPEFIWILHGNAGSFSMVSAHVSICKYVHSFHFLLIGMKKMEYKTRQWHEKCFVCCTCHNPIGTKSFIPKEHDIYCAKCYEDKFATKCIKCSKVKFKIILHKVWIS